MNINSALKKLFSYFY